MNLQISKYLTMLVFATGLTSSMVIPVCAETRSYQRTVEKYSLPDVTLINQNGIKVRLKSILETDKPVVVDFIFGTCTTICTVLSADYADLQQKLGTDSNNVHFISFSIDPENDTPKVMKDYLKRYRAKQGWDFFTGSREDIDKVMKAFNAYIPNKMYHYPLMLIHTPKDVAWLRIYGLTSTTEFLNEYKKVSGL